MAETPHLDRRGFLTRSAAVGGLLVVPGLLTACAKKDDGGDGGSGSSGEEGMLAKMKKQGFIRVAYANEAPYGFEEGGELKGQAPTLHGEVFKALGIPKLKPTFTEWDGLIPGLKADKYDVISAGMAILPERCEQALFSEPEFVSKTALMVKKGNPKKLTDLASAEKAGVKLGVMAGAVEKDYATGLGFAEDALVTVPKQQDGADALKGGRIDAFCLTGISLNWLAKTNPEVEVLKPFWPELDGKEQYSAGGAVFQQGAEEVRDAYNKELKKITSDEKRFTELLGEYGFTKYEMPPADLTAEELCKAPA